MPVEIIWNWFVIPALAAVAICVIGITGRHLISGDVKHPIAQFGVAFAVIVVVAIGGGLVINQMAPPQPDAPTHG